MGDTAPNKEKIRCDACPVMCYIADGKAGACDRYANEGGQLVRLDPLTVVRRRIDEGGEVVRFLDEGQDWDGDLVSADTTFITAVGAGTTYPDYKPAPFIVSSEVDGMSTPSMLLSYRTTRSGSRSTDSVSRAAVASRLFFSRVSSTVV